MSILPNPVSLFHESLRQIDGGLQNVALAAEALNRSRSALPPVTSDFNEREYDSFIGKTIEAIRGQVQRGLPVTSLPLSTLVSIPSTRVV
jgi:hypothetical protein